MMSRRWAAAAAVVLITGLAVLVAGDQVTAAPNVDTAASPTLSSHESSPADTLRDATVPARERASGERTHAVKRIVPIAVLALGVVALAVEHRRRRRRSAARTQPISLWCSLWRRGPPALLPIA